MKRIVPKVIYCLRYCFLLIKDCMHNEVRMGLCGNSAKLAHGNKLILIADSSNEGLEVVNV